MRFLWLLNSGIKTSKTIKNHILLAIVYDYNIGLSSSLNQHPTKDHPQFQLKTKKKLSTTLKMSAKIRYLIIVVSDLVAPN